MPKINQTWGLTSWLTWSKKARRILSRCVWVNKQLNHTENILDLTRSLKLAARIVKGNAPQYKQKYIFFIFWLRIIMNMIFTWAGLNNNTYGEKKRKENYFQTLVKTLINDTSAESILALSIGLVNS